MGLTIIVAATDLLVNSQNHETKTCDNHGDGKKLGEVYQEPFGIDPFRNSAAPDTLAAEDHLHEFGDDPHDMPVNIYDRLLSRVVTLFVVKLDELDFDLLLFLSNSETFGLMFPLFYLFDVNFVT